MVQCENPPAPPRRRTLPGGTGAGVPLSAEAMGQLAMAYQAGGAVAASRCLGGLLGKTGYGGGWLDEHAVSDVTELRFWSAPGP
jgi:hypothetical protein